jgi:uncharacterized protein (DUF1800 family)
MSLDPKIQAALALHRFGFGPRAGSIAAIASDPRGALLAELDRPDAGRVADKSLPGSAESSRLVFEFNQERNAQQKVERSKREDEQKMASASGTEKPPEAAASPPAAAAASPPTAAASPPAAAASPPVAAASPPVAQPAKPARPAEPPLPQKLFLQEATARVEAAVAAEIGFAERLVWFWSNHFCVTADKVQAMAGGYEREAIRAHALGRFGDMLLAAEGHPAMLLYLDNAQSIGPNSTGGINQTKGLNENLAREILELHTLGVDGGYTQDDVTRFANVLTGWSVIPTGPDPERGSEFVFIKRSHEPGPLTVLGKVYPDTGVEQGRAVLADLARHPKTATHIATKLARHFIADQPPPALVNRLARRFMDTDGNLKEVAKTLILGSEGWSPKQEKIKRPGEWMVATLRASGIPLNIGQLTGAQTQLGESLWRPAAPKGFPDDNAAWTDGLAQRLDMANEFANRFAGKVDPQAMLDTALGPLASQETRETVARAGSRAQAIALLLMAPEFQRR